ncbi:peptide chain release factor N(5)-glutamine methyltransferase [Nitratireductor sp. XY-223]|uniref:peptide chain release factor N(5)-glutamine methyltransferase n=1 Tax=Nitratireductor sp. XY-223 TaxID=2561926 RepID=UPI0010AA21C1|nr:peptide chain release factor N(5)-glutamine methyltransferase [Nitratireductor sp. XY-223]
MPDAAAATAATKKALVAELSCQFEAAGLPQPNDDARTLVCGLLNISLTDLVLDRGEPLNPAQTERVRSAAARRLRREPVHRILGSRSFFGLDLELSPETLEPRPDTETLVSAVLPFVRALAVERGRCRVLDIGTGSGAVCLALLAEVGSATGTGTDISREALGTARDNARRAGLSERFDTCEAAWFAGVEGVFDLIVSNPPYIPSGDIAGLEPEVRDFDPVIALDGGADGLDAYRAIAVGADVHLAPGGRVAVETGFSQHAAVTGIFEANRFPCIDGVKDLAGNDRVLIFAKPG